MKECSLPASISTCSVFSMETIPAPTKKTNPCKEATRGKEAQEDCLRWEQWPFMNISGIPQLQTAAGLSIGEVVVPAEGHRNMTLQGGGAWLQQRCTVPNGKSMLTQVSGIVTGWNIVQPDTSKQTQCVHKEKRPFLQWKA